MVFLFTHKDFTIETNEFKSIEEAEEFGEKIGAIEVIVKTKKHRYDRTEKE